MQVELFNNYFIKNKVNDSSSRINSFKKKSLSELENSYGYPKDIFLL